MIFHLSFRSYSFIIANKEGEEYTLPNTYSRNLLKNINLGENYYVNMMRPSKIYNIQ